MNPPPRGAAGPLALMLGRARMVKQIHIWMMYPACLLFSYIRKISLYMYESNLSSFPYIWMNEQGL
jgi:hypothetical protein